MANARRKQKKSTSRAPARPPARKPAPQPEHLQVGRRPSRPGFLALVGIMWIAVGIVEFVALHASWRFVPGIVFVGIGILFLRGAATAAARHEDRRSLQ
jgi:hypothetical protein